MEWQHERSKKRIEPITREEIQRYQYITLSSWFEHISKQKIKAPKIYFRDSRILHTLNGIGSARPIAIYPRLGESWEGFALKEIILATDI